MSESSNPARWERDPLGRHEFRYWDGVTWTDHVADQGVQSLDPLAPVAAPSMAPAIVSVAAPMVSPAALPPPSVPVAPSDATMAYAPTDTRWRPTRGLCTSLSWLFGLNAAAAALLVAAIGNRLSVIDGIENGTASFDEAQSADDFVTTAAVIFLLVAIAALVVVIIWQWRGAKNAEALGTVQLRHTPGWSIAGWFIPFANLVIPVRVMQDLWQSGDPEAGHLTPWRTLRRSSLVGWWWAVFVIGALIGRGTTGSGDSLDEIRTSNQIALAAEIFLCVAAVLAIFVVRAITARQEAARGRMATS